jgi:hypothetical protein
MCKSRTILESLKKREDHGMTNVQIELAEAQAYDFEKIDERFKNLENFAIEQKKASDIMIKNQSDMVDTLKETVRDANYWRLGVKVFTSWQFITIISVFIVAISFGGEKFIDKAGGLVAQTVSSNYNGKPVQ